MSKPTLIFAGPVATRSGYGDHARDLVLSLIKMDKFDVKILSLKWGNTPMNQLNPNNPDDLSILTRILSEPIRQQPDIWVQLSVANEFNAVGKYNVGITAGLETTSIPMNWVEGCNKMNLIIVPSVHSKECILKTSYTEARRDTGEVIKVHSVKTPVEILFEGSCEKIFNNIYTPDPFVESEMNVVKDDFNFLFVGHWMQGDLGHDRKDVGMLIKTFLTVFKNKKKAPGLILKTSSATFSVIDREAILDKIKAIKQSIKGDLPNIYLLHGDLSPVQMNSLYNHPKVKLMVSFTKGEGYGRPLQEFSFTGKPILASNWSGHVDFLKRYGMLIGGSLEKVHKSAQNDFLTGDASWFTVNYNEAAGMLDAMYKDYANILPQSQNNRSKMVPSLTLESMDIEFESIVAKYFPGTSQVTLELPKLILPKLKKVNV